VKEQNLQLYTPAAIIGSKVFLGVGSQGKRIVTGHELGQMLTRQAVTDCIERHLLLEELLHSIF